MKILGFFWGKKWGWSADSRRVLTNLIAAVETVTLMGHWLLCPCGWGLAQVLIVFAKGFDVSFCTWPYLQMK